MNPELDTKQTAGSGGGLADTQAQPSYHDGLHQIVANQVSIVSRPPLPPAEPDPCVVSILAAGLTPTGRVEVRGSQGVRITSGPPMLPPMTSSATNGVEVIASEAQNVTIQRGLIEGVDQKIQMAPASITIDGGAGTITIQSLTEITLSVAGGLSSITLTPAGITIQGVLVQIN
jgi:hypothetical protein